MNRDDIIRMAREAGLKAAGDYDFRGSYESMPLFEREELDRVLKFATLVAAAERAALNAQEPVAWMVYTLDGKSVCVTDSPSDFTDGQRALPLFTLPISHNPVTIRARGEG